MVDLAKLMSDPVAFRNEIKIDADGKSVRLSKVLDDWQRTDFEAMDPAWRVVVGQPRSPETKLRSWRELPRGHSKTNDIGVQVVFALFASKRPIVGYCAAADRDQAGLIRNAIQRLVTLNPWLQSILDVQQWRVVNRHTASSLEIISSDSMTSFGLLPDFVVCEELTCWSKPDLWHSLLSSAAKRASCLLLCISNAGFMESWQWETREAIRNDPNWYFSRLDGPKASWITPDRLEEQRRLLPKLAFDRLWLNRWSAGSGDALTADDIAASIRLSGPLSQPERGYVYFAGLDLGLSRDKAALAVIGRHVGYSESTEKPLILSDRQKLLIEAGVMDEPEPEFDEQFIQATGKLKLVNLLVWNPADQATGKVEIEVIEQAIAELDARFRLVTVGADPWQTSYLIERLQKRGIPTEPVTFTAQNLTSMCTEVLSSFSNRNLELYHEPQLIRDLHSLKVTEKSYGVRLESPRGLDGHGDAATSLAIALFCAKATRNAIASIAADTKLIAY